MGRLPNWRRVSYVPEITYFKPSGTTQRAFEEVCLTIDEAEAIRLKDSEGLEQEQCARSMRISRSTFGRILESARHKIADALLHGKAIRIEGGNYEMATRHFRCLDGHEWDVPFEAMIKGQPQVCPRCKNQGMLPPHPAPWGRKRGGWGNRHRGHRW